MSGPVGRILDAGAQAYQPARPVQKVAENVRAYLATVEQRQLTRGSASAVGAFLMPPSEDPYLVLIPGPGGRKAGRSPDGPHAWLPRS
jgi:hypothetical protein